jgi:hypothetical protein
MLYIFIFIAVFVVGFYIQYRFDVNRTDRALRWRWEECQELHALKANKKDFEDLKSDFESLTEWFDVEFKNIDVKKRVIVSKGTPQKQNKKSK